MPGAIHLFKGLYGAKLDRQPVVAIVGQQKRASLGSEYQQEVKLELPFSDVSEFCQVVMDPPRVRHVIDRAFKTALSRRGVATVIIPVDVQELPAVPSDPCPRLNPGSPGTTAPCTGPGHPAGLRALIRP